MATVSVQPKGDTWYTVISFKDSDGKWKNKMQTTKLPLKGNKKKAEKIAAERLSAFKEPERKDPDNPLFVDFIEDWLEFKEPLVEISTYGGYVSTVKSVHIPYFKSNQIRLKDLNLREVQKFYDEMMRSNRGRGGKNPAPSTIHKYHTLLHEILEYAVLMEMIPFNPASRAVLPKNTEPNHNTFTEDELRRLNSLLENELIGPMILFDSLLAIRRSETVGIRWKVADFDNNLIAINHTVVEAKDKNGKKILVKKDRTKSKKSNRTLPMTPEMKIVLLNLKKQQEENRKLFGNAYNEADSEYVFVDELGNLITPGYLSRRYTRLRNKYKLPKVTLHELRHTVATLLAKHKIHMKYIQLTLGHSDISTTANIYMHSAADEATYESVNMMRKILNGEE